MRRAFTLVELLVVLAISALFSTLAITYSTAGRNSTALTIEESKISQFILQAKELALSTYTATGQSVHSCGFGVTFNIGSSPQTYSIFSYDPVGYPPCPDPSTIIGISTGNNEEQEYTPGTWQVPISQGVVMQAESDSLVTILFYPPEPTVFLSSDGATFNSSVNSLNIHLETVDHKNSATLSVNSEGQVAF